MGAYDVEGLKSLQRIIKMFLVIVFILPVSQGNATISFRDIAESAGITRLHQQSGESFGVAWVDFNGDNWPDLWVGNHMGKNYPNLYMNKRNLKFTDVGPTVYPAAPTDDTHGCAWMDFNNDGRPDLVEVTGAEKGTGSNPNHLFVNENGLLRDAAQELGFDYPIARGRAPLWVDWDNDGYLDIVQLNVMRPDKQGASAAFHQSAGRFEDESREMGFELDGNSLFAELADVSGDGILDLIVHGGNTPQRIYDLSARPFANLTNRIRKKDFVVDMAIMDFNGDLRPDIFETRRIARISDAVQPDPLQILMHFESNSDEKGVTFTAEDELIVSVRGEITPEEVFIGRLGIHPEGIKFRVSRTTANNGTKPHDAGSSDGLYIGFDESLELWKFLYSNPGRKKVGVYVTSSTPLSNLTAVGFDPSRFSISPAYMQAKGTQYYDRTTELLPEGLPPCGSAVANDFDNDMDVDLFLVCERPALRLPNVLLENDGSGRFTQVADAGGAADAILCNPGGAFDSGQRIAMADFNLDGYPDLFITPSGAGPLSNCPPRLFLNTGSGNNWIELDLEGVISNRDGVGARVLATAVGVTQLREQGGGMHRFAQNYQRLHFGLAKHTQVDNLTVYWPSGVCQVLENVPANQLLRVVEPSAPSVIGRPPYAKGDPAGVHIWKNRADGPYLMRITGAESESAFTVHVISDGRIRGVSTYGISATDKFELGTSSFTLSAVPSNSGKGINFSLPSGSRAMISVEQNGIANPRQLHIGAANLPLSPAGWIVSSSILMTIDTQSPIPRAAGTVLTLGKGSEPGTTVEAQWKGRGTHATELTVISSDAISSIVPLGLEKSDILTSTSRSVHVKGSTGPNSDGIRFSLGKQSDLAIAYRQDGIFPYLAVNPDTKNLGIPTAYWLPL